MRKDSFEKFYMEKVALGEGCGCAEMAINMRDVDAEMRGGDGSRDPHRRGATSPAVSWAARARLVLRTFRRRRHGGTP